MVAGRPDSNTLIGQLTAQLGEDELEIWEENIMAVRIFGDMLTQWNAGPSGLVGLRYESLPVVMRYRGVPAAERAGVFDAVRVMERAALETIRGE